MKPSFFLLFLVSLVYPIKIQNLPGQPKVDFNQYSGYLDVGKEKTHHLHYWFVESQSNPETDPLVLWLNGGPGCSSLLGFFGENGPFTLVTTTQMKINPHSWNLNASVIYLESPARVGLSYTDDPNDISTNDDQTALEKWEGLVEFFKAFPQFKKNDFYVTGESYAGTYIPMLVDNILKKQDEFHINLKGMAIGNGCVDRDLQSKTLYPFLYQHSLIDHRTWLEYSKECCDDKVIDCEKKQTQACVDVDGRIRWDYGMAPYNEYNIYQFCDPGLSDINYSKYMKRTATRKPWLPECDNTHEIRLYLNKKAVRKAIGVPENVGEYHNCAPETQLDYHSQYHDMHDQVQRALAAGIKTMLYYGDVDSVCNIMHGQRFADQFIQKNNTLKWYRVNGYAAGLWVEETNIRFVTVRGAGHMVPTDKPIISKHILDKFIDWKPLS